MDWQEDFDNSLLDDEALDFLIKNELDEKSVRRSGRGTKPDV
jgi:hypothetical protein